MGSQQVCTCTVEKTCDTENAVPTPKKLFSVLDVALPPTLMIRLVRMEHQGVQDSMYYLAIDHHIISDSRHDCEQRLYIIRTALATPAVLTITISSTTLTPAIDLKLFSDFTILVAGDADIDCDIAC